MFDRLRNAITTLERCARELQVECVDGVDAAELVAVVGRGERVCAAMKGLLATRVAETGVWRADGSRSAGHWLAERSGVTVGAAQQAIESARALQDLPATEEAFRAGELSSIQAAEIAAAAEADPSAEAQLLETARTTSVKGLRDECRQVRAGAQADDAAWAEQLVNSRRASEWYEPDGAYRADVRMAPDAGARFSAAWRAETDRIFEEARRAGRHEPRAAYAADALVRLVTDGPRKATATSLIVDAAAIPRGHTVAGERCELDGIPIPVAVARRLLNDTSVSLLVRRDGELRAVGKAVRTIPAKLRRELNAAYPVCGVKGCANDRFLEIDHVVPISEGGLTTRQNTWRLCPHHHFLKHHWGWVVIGSPGEWDLVAPGDPRAPP
jgi:hypothetical protein